MPLDERVATRIVEHLGGVAAGVASRLSADWCVMLVGQGDNVCGTLQVDARFVSMPGWEAVIAKELRTYANDIEGGALSAQIAASLGSIPE